MKAAAHPSVISCGALNMDYVYRVDRIVRDGSGVLESARITPGGSAANTVYGLSKLGIGAGFIGAIGDDDQGRSIMADFAKVGVDTSNIRVKTMAPSGSVVSLSDGKKAHAVYVSPGANDLFSWSDIDLGYACNGKFLHLSSFIGRKQLAIQIDLAQCPTSGVCVTLAPGMQYARLGLLAVTPLLRRTSVLFLNREQLWTLTGEDIEAGSRICRAQGVGTVLVSLDKGINREDGTATVYMLTRTESTYIVPPNQDLSPATGRGAVDAFAAGFLYGLAREKPLHACALLGDAVARISMAGVGARDGLPSLAEVGRRFPHIAP